MLRPLSGRVDGLGAKVVLAVFRSSQEKSNGI
jgi:hypothetical protein